MTEAEILERRANAKPSKYLAFINKKRFCKKCGVQIFRDLCDIMKKTNLFCGKACYSAFQSTWTVEDIEKLKAMLTAGYQPKEMQPNLKGKTLRQIHNKLQTVRMEKI
jgi:hypothetical protein